MRLKLPVYLACLGLLSSTGCNVLKTTDGEGISGRGAKAFDPYSSSASGAIGLALQMFNGCAIEPYGRVAGASSVPGLKYPNGAYTDCKWREDESHGIFLHDPSLPEPTDPIHLVAGTTYFLNQLTIENSAINIPAEKAMPHDPAAPSDPTQINVVPQWFTTLPPFDKLDWSNLTITEDHLESSQISISPYSFARRIYWGGANWQNVKDDTFKVEVLDADGNVRATETYAHEDFLIENPATGHTMLRWQADAIQAPAFPGDQSIRPANAITPPPGFPPTGNPEFASIFKIEMKTAVHPSKQFTLPKGVTGDGAIRITWSQLPDDPFYWPVHFDDPASLPATCYAAADNSPVPCTFGNQPTATFSPPANGKGYYEPGETFSVTLRVKDSAGNYINAPDHFPSWNDYHAGNSNGLMYFNFVNFGPQNDDYDTISGSTVVGPKQDMRPIYELNDRSFFRAPTDQLIAGVGNAGLNMLVNPTTVANALPGALDAEPPTTWTYTIPTDAKPGTYVLWFKVNRYFEGERFTKNVPIDFQVGQAEATKFPGRVGNCQICHRGAISLDNVRHGVPVDYVEGCKVCHNRDVFPGGRINSTQVLIHRIHMSSTKYPFPKNECTVCHLTRESTLRPSYAVCSSCHASPHGGQYAQLEDTTDQDPTIKETIYGDCGSACHATNPPTQHILPPQ